MPLREFRFGLALAAVLLPVGPARAVTISERVSLTPDEQTEIPADLSMRYTGAGDSSGSTYFLNPLPTVSDFMLRNWSSMDTIDPMVSKSLTATSVATGTETFLITVSSPVTPP
jgi:hypothetical protein